ncbi:MAG: cell division protein FtsZ [Verrucomicrobiales bacterium]|nr:cell division protein FtsZ [Verrucomicrobiales bacterium]
MIEYDESVHGELQLDSDLGVKVIGVGGAGANILDRMALEGSDVAELLAVNTDVRALKNSVSSEKIQLGSTLLKGMGTGGDPALGKQAALEAVDGIREAVRGAGMVFVCVGLGGGTGSGAAPEICRIAKEEGVFLVVFATLPFSFEGQRRMDQAEKSLGTIGRYADAVITFDNDRMGELIVPKDGVTQAFAAADKIISQSIRATMNIVFRPGIIHIGMDDLLAALESRNSRCLFGYGVSKGDNRSHEAVEQAMKCPLLDRGKLLSEAKAVLVQVSGGDNMTLFEVQMVMEEVSKHVGSETQILFGTGTDKRLGSALAVTIISSVPGPAVSSVGDEGEAETISSPVSLGMSADEAVAPVATIKLPESKPEPEEITKKASAPAMEQVDLPAAVESVDDFEDMTAPIGEGLGDDTVEEDETLVFEPLDDDDEEEPAYAPVFESDEEPAEVSDGRNPIARAIEDSQVADTGSIAPIQPADLDPAEEDDAGHVEAVTESSQKITLTRVVGSGNTGRIKTRSPGDGDSRGPVMPPTKPPATPPENLEEDDEIPDDVKQQQELLQLEPVKSKGRFAKTDPTIVDGEDLDVPTFLRKNK